VEAVAVDQLGSKVAVEGDAVFRPDGQGLLWRGGCRYRAIIELFASKQPLAAGHTVDSATDVLFILLGPDTYRAFIRGCGWPLDQWKTWVTTNLERGLFTQPASGTA